MEIYENSKLADASINKDSPSDSTEVIFKFLKYFGIHIVKSSNHYPLITKLSMYIYPLYAYISLIIIITMFTSHMLNSMANAKTNVAYDIINILSVILWHALYKKKNTLRCIYQKISKASYYNSISNMPKHYIIKILLLLNFILIITCASMHVIGLSEADYFCQVFSYHIWVKCKDGFLNKLYIFINAIVMHFMASTFINVIAFLYCILCYRCSLLLSKYKYHFRKAVLLKSYNNLEVEMVQEYFSVIKLIENIEYVFSLPSLLLLMISFMQAFVSLARFMVNSRREFTYFFMVEHICLHFPTGVFTFLIPVCAAQVKNEMEKNNALFNKIYESLLLHPENLVNKRYILIMKLLKNKPPVTLTAWNMVEFDGSTLPVIIGNFLTYGLLILNLNI